MKNLFVVQNNITRIKLADALPDDLVLFADDPAFKTKVLGLEIKAAVYLGVAPTDEQEHIVLSCMNTRGIYRTNRKITVIIMP